MIFVEESGERHDDTREQSEEIHEIEDAQFPFIIAAKGRLVPDIPDISPETENTFRSLVHGQSLGFSFKGGDRKRNPKDRAQLKRE